MNSDQQPEFSVVPREAKIVVTHNELNPTLTRLKELDAVVLRLDVDQRGYTVTALLPQDVVMELHRCA